MDTTAIVELIDVSKDFRGKPAVTGITAKVPTGSCFAWLGPSGAGKTTLIRMMIGAIRPTKGRIIIRGYNIEQQPSEALARVGVVVAEPQFYPYLSGKENLSIWAAHYQSQAKKHAPYLLERVGLGPYANTRVSAYSPSMCQRLAIARALLNNPELLILDDPLNGLDSAELTEFRLLIRSFVEQDKRTVFICSQLLNEVQKFADNVAMVQGGRLLSLLSMDELVQDNQGWFEMEVDDPAAAILVLRDQMGVRKIRPLPGRRLQILVTAPDESTATLLTTALVTRRIGLVEFIRFYPTLEQRFSEVISDTTSSTMASV